MLFTLFFVWQAAARHQSRGWEVDRWWVQLLMRRDLQMLGRVLQGWHAQCQLWRHLSRGQGWSKKDGWPYGREGACDPEEVSGGNLLRAGPMFHLLRSHRHKHKSRTRHGLADSILSSCVIHYICTFSFLENLKAVFELLHRMWARNHFHNPSLDMALYLAFSPWHWKWGTAVAQLDQTYPMWVAFALLQSKGPDLLWGSLAQFSPKKTNWFEGKLPCSNCSPPVGLPCSRVRWSTCGHGTFC